MLRNKSVTMGVIFASITLSVLGMLFYSGYFLYDYYKNETDSEVVISLKENSSSKDVINLLRDISIKEKHISEMWVYKDSPENAEVIGGYNKQWKDHTLVGKAYHIKDDKPYVLIAESLVESMEKFDKPTDKKVVIKGKELRIGGVIPYSDYDNYILPICFYINNYETDYINIKFDGKYYKKLLKSVLDKNELVKEYDIEDKNPFFSEDFMSAFIQILLIFSAVLINVFCMAYAWIKKFNKKFKIYAICGGTRTDIVEITMLQTFIVMFSGVALGNILFIILKEIIKSDEIVYQNSYVPYLGISLIIVVILMLFSYVLAIKSTKTDIIYNTME